MQVASMTSNPIGQTASASQDRQAALETAAQGFEALFLQEMLKAGRSAQLGEGFLSSSATRTAEQMLDGALAESGAKRAGLGLAGAIARQFAPLIGRG